MLWLLELQPFDLVHDGELAIGALVPRVLDRRLARAEETGTPPSRLANDPVKPAEFSPRRKNGAVAGVTRLKQQGKSRSDADFAPLPAIPAAGRRA